MRHRCLNNEPGLGAHTTEASTRFTVLSGIVTSLGSQQQQIVLEMPRHLLPGKKKLENVVVGNADNEWLLAMEMKFHRTVPGVNYPGTPTPQFAGAAIKDLARLSFEYPTPVRRLLVYCTKEHMHYYLPKHGHGFYTSELGRWNSRAFSIATLFAHDINRGEVHDYFRVFEVRL
jgi:hypothetical protein